MIKLICIDMDGTLLNNNHSVSEENKKALKLASDKGISIAITTGRIFTSARFYADLIGISTPIIASNGAYIRNKCTDQVIYENPLTLDETLEINSILEKYNFNTFFNTSNTVISKSIFKDDHAYKISNVDVLPKYQTQFITKSDLTDTLKTLDGQILKSIAIDATRENLSSLLKAKKELQNFNKYEVVSSGPYNFEVMKKGTSKGNAVLHLAKILNISSDNIMCIGDSENDLSMLNIANIKVAMGNGLDIVKENATFVTDTNENSGVSKAILKYI